MFVHDERGFALGQNQMFPSKGYLHQERHDC